MIVGIGGKLSGGKTVTMVRYAHDKWLKGKKVISNFRVKFSDTNENVYFMSNTVFVDWLKSNYMDQEALKDMFFNSVLLQDEIVNLASGRRTSTTLNEMITNFYMMAGKLDCDIVFSFQKDTMADIRLREIANIYCNCYRISENKQPLIWKDRKVKEKVYIAVISMLDFDILGQQIVTEVYDPSPYFKMYDTREITLLDRSKYMRGGSKDLRRA